MDRGNDDTDKPAQGTGYFTVNDREVPEDELQEQAPQTPPAMIGGGGRPT
jgi:hypothetical protein